MFDDVHPFFISLTEITPQRINRRESLGTQITDHKTLSISEEDSQKLSDRLSRYSGSVATNVLLW
jgi:hypothetical protein